MRAQYGTRLATLKTTSHKDGQFLIIILSQLRYNEWIDDRLKAVILSKIIAIEWRLVEIVALEIKYDIFLFVREAEYDAEAAAQKAIIATY